MRRAAATVVVVACILLVADFVLRAAAENAAADLIDKRIQQDVNPAVGLGGFPFLWSTLRGRFDEVTVSVPRVRERRLVVEDVRLTFDDVKLEALEVLGGRGDLRAASVRGRGTITEAALNDAIAAESQDVEVTIEQDRVVLTRGDASLPATMVVARDQLVISAGQVLGPIEIPLPSVLEEISFSSLDARPGELVLGVRADRVRIRV